MVRTLVALTSVEPGFDVEQVASVSTVFPSMRYRPGSAELSAYLERAVAELEQIPGVERAASCTLGPLGGAVQRNVRVQGAGAGDAGAGEEWVRAVQHAVSAAYFPTAGVEILRGRALGEHERSEVAVVNEALAEQLFGTSDPLGRRIELQSPLREEPYSLAVVGIGEGERLFGLEEPPPGTVYIPHLFDTAPYATFLVRATGDPAALKEVLRRRVAAIDPEVAIDRVQTLGEAARGSVARETTILYLLAAFAALSLVLALVGIYGVVALMVTRRTREFGVRMSLGASPGGILRRVLREGLLLSLLGLVLGVAGALLLMRWLKALLFEVSLSDPLTLGVVAVLVVAVSLLACWTPARRASRVDPVIALRAQ